MSAPDEPAAMSPDGLQPLRRSPRLYEQVVQQLIAWAEAGDLGPGDRLPAERDLAVRLGSAAPRWPRRSSRSRSGWRR